MTRPIRVVIFERDLMPVPDMPGTVWATQHMGLKTCVARGKQSSRLLLHVAEQMGARPEECATVCSGNDGVAAGRRAGMHVVAYSGGDSDRDELLREGGASVIDELRDLPELLRAANSAVAA